MFELLSLSPPLATLDWRAGLRGAGKKTRHLDFKLLRRLVWAGDCGLDVLTKLHQSVARQYWEATLLITNSSLDTRGKEQTWWWWWWSNWISTVSFLSFVFPPNKTISDDKNWINLSLPTATMYWATHQHSLNFSISRYFLFVQCNCYHIKAGTCHQCSPIVKQCSHLWLGAQVQESHCWQWCGTYHWHETGTMLTQWYHECEVQRGAETVIILIR